MYQVNNGETAVSDKVVPIRIDMPTSLGNDKEVHIYFHHAHVADNLSGEVGQLWLLNGLLLILVMFLSLT